MYIWAQNNIQNKKGYILSEGLSASNGHLSHERGNEANFPVLTPWGFFDLLVEEKCTYLIVKV